MTTVRAGAEHAGCYAGQAGLTTIWVRSNSEDEALEHARRVIAGRRYESTGELAIYEEETGPGLSPIPEASFGGSGVAAGYASMKQRAMERGDGLFELWYPDEPNEFGGSTTAAQ